MHTCNLQPRRSWIARLGALIVVWVAFTLAPVAHATPAATIVNQPILTNTTWTKAGSPYQVSNFVYVKTGVTLTVEPGVEVVFNQNSSFAVQGTLTALGTAAEPILFTGAIKTPGSWSGVNVNHALGTEPSAVLNLNYVTVEYGGLPARPTGGNLEIIRAIADIHNSTFRFGGSQGVTAAANTTLTIADSSFVNNGEHALVLTGLTTLHPTLSNLTASGNGIANAVVFRATHLEGEHAFVKMGLPYIFEDGMDVEETGHMRLAAGLEIQVDTGFYVDGVLTALGTAAEPVLITGMIRQPGGWWGINISGTSEHLAKATLDQVIVEYGGKAQENNYEANLIIGSAQVTVTNSTLRNSGANGVSNHGAGAEDNHHTYIADTIIRNNGGYALFCDDDNCNTTLGALTVSGNGTDGFAINGTVGGNTVWQNIGLPYIVENQSGVDRDGILTIEPGVEVRFAQNASFDVGGTLLAVGTPDQPIRFTGTQAQPGWWEGLRLDSERGYAELRYCDIGYGLINLEIGASATFVTQCRIHDAAGPGIAIGPNVQPSIQYNRIEANVQGLVAADSVDARYHWWGAASGPQHATNPGGTGQLIVGDVQFSPWLTSPDQTAGGRDLNVNLAGPGRFAPGDTAVYSVFYTNFTGATVENAVLRFALPAYAQLVETSAGGVFWPARNQVFWPLGPLAHGGQGTLFVRVRYDWGLQDGLKTTTVAQLSGSNVTSPLFPVADYLSYTPRVISGQNTLSAEQVQAERTAHPALDQLYTQATGQGFVFADAEQRTYTSGEQETEILLLRFKPYLAAFYLWQTGDTSTGALVENSAYTVHRIGSALRYDLQTGSWSPVDTGLVQAASVDWDDCMQNCIAEKLPGYIIKKRIKALSDVSKAVSCYAAASGDDDGILGCAKTLKKVVPFIGEAIDLGECNGECQLCEESGGECDNPNCHCCTEDKYGCDANDWLYGSFGIDVVKVRRCSEVTGRYLAEEVIQVCALCEKCIEGNNSPICVAKNLFAVLNLARGTAAVASQEQADSRFASIAGGSDQECEECRQARDPNELAGPSGDLLPGQLITYTITYENVGAGQAFDVFVVDTLDEVFDASTVVVHGNGRFSPSARTLFWTVGELAPKGQPGSTGTVSFSVRLKRGLPSGTVIANQAVVHFPSVPEETPTNTVVNTVQPLVASAQRLTTEAGQPIAFTLSGSDVSGLPVTFAVVDAPLYGTLSGNAPALVYTPAANFNGLDRLFFTVSNGSSTRQGEITLQVQPAANDQQPPAVVWTAPAADEIVQLGAVVAVTGAEGTYYYPALQVQFSEALDANTVNSATILVTGANGQPIPATVRYDGPSEQAVILLGQAPQAGAAYTVAVTPGVKDRRGNPLATNYQWNFQVSGGIAGTIYLPLVSR